MRWTINPLNQEACVHWHTNCHAWMHPSMHRCIHPSINPSFHPSIINLSSINPSIRLSINTSIHSSTVVECKKKECKKKILQPSSLTPSLLWPPPTPFWRPEQDRLMQIRRSVSLSLAWSTALVSLQSAIYYSAKSQARSPEKHI